MKEFVVKLVIDEELYDGHFIKNTIDKMTRNKSNVKVVSVRPLNLSGADYEFSEQQLDMKGNILFFWNGKDPKTKKKIKEAVDNGANIRITRYDTFPLKAWIGIKWCFPKTKYKSYESKPFNNWWHLKNWLDKINGNIVGFEYRIDHEK